MISSNVRKKIREPPNVIKVQSHVMLVLHNVRMIPSNVRKKKGTTKCEKKKRKRELPNVTKVQLHMMLVLHNVRMVLSNVRKNKGTTECDKNTVTCDVGSV